MQLGLCAGPAGEVGVASRDGGAGEALDRAGLAVAGHALRLDVSEGGFGGVDDGGRHGVARGGVGAGENGGNVFVLVRKAKLEFLYQNILFQPKNTFFCQINLFWKNFTC